MPTHIAPNSQSSFVHAHGLSLCLCSVDASTSAGQSFVVEKLNRKLVFFSDLLKRTPHKLNIEMKSFLGMFAFENAFSAFKWLRYSPCCNALHTNRPPPSHRNVFVCALSLFWFGVLQAQIFEIALENVWLTVNSAWSRTLYRVSVCVDFSFVRVWVGGCHKITSPPLKIPMIFFLMFVYLPANKCYRTSN